MKCVGERRNPTGSRKASQLKIINKSQDDTEETFCLKHLVEVTAEQQMVGDVASLPQIAYT